MARSSAGERIFLLSAGGNGEAPDTPSANLSEVLKNMVSVIGNTQRNSMQSHTTRALAEGILRLDRSNKVEKIVYVAVNRMERWSDSEEKVRAEFYAELIYRYGYEAKKIGVEVTVPDRLL
jgi:hypothetical protein